MNNSELKVIRFGNNDVIATSNEITLKGFADGNLTNQEMTYNGVKVIKVTCSSGADAWNDIFSEASGGATTYRFTDGTKSLTLNGALATSPKTDGSSLSLLNNTFVYDETYTFNKKTGYFVKQ